MHLENDIVRFSWSSEYNSDCRLCDFYRNDTIYIVITQYFGNLIIRLFGR